MTSRYSGDPRINLGQQLGVPKTYLLIKKAIKNGNIPIIKTITTSGSERLDNLAGTIYGDSSLWWVLAVASGIGWGLQVPPNTTINIVKMSDIDRLL